MEARVTKVYISNFVGHDYTDAQEYGEFVPVTKGYVSFGSLDRLMYTIAEAIKDSKEDDYLLLSGNNILSLIIGLVWYQKHNGIRLLVWDKQAAKNGKNMYREWTVNLNQLATLLSEV